MSATADAAEGERQLAAKLGIAAGHIVQELGYDSDCDEGLRASVAAVAGSALVDESFGEVVDVVLLWWRDDDGDLVDALMDALISLDDGGVIWLLTPKSGRSGHVEPSDVGEAAPTAGLNITSSTAAARDWSGTRLVARGASRK